MVTHLKRNYSFIFLWRISNDIGKIAIERQQDRVEFLRFRDYNSIRRLYRKHVSQSNNFVLGISQELYREVRDAVVGQEPQGH